MPSRDRSLGAGGTPGRGDAVGASAPLVTAIGLPMGAVGLDPAEATGRSLVATAQDLVELTPDYYLLWAGALTPQPVTALTAWAAGRGLSEPGPMVQTLRRNGMLAALPTPEQMAEWSTQHRLIPQGNGMGSNEEDPDVLTIGDRSGDRLIGVDAAIYYLWGLSASTANLAATMEAVVRATDISLDWLRHRTCEVLPELIRWRVAHLDLT